MMCENHTSFQGLLRHTLVLRSVDLWVKKSVKYCAFLLRRCACLPAARASRTSLPTNTSTLVHHIEMRVAVVQTHRSSDYVSFGGKSRVGRPLFPNRSLSLSLSDSPVVHIKQEAELSASISPAAARRSR